MKKLKNLKYTMMGFVAGSIVSLSMLIPMGISWNIDVNKDYRDFNINVYAETKNHYTESYIDNENVKWDELKNDLETETTNAIAVDSEGNDKPAPADKLQTVTIDLTMMRNGHEVNGLFRKEKNKVAFTYFREEFRNDFRKNNESSLKQSLYTWFNVWGTNNLGERKLVVSRNGQPIEIIDNGGAGNKGNYMQELTGKKGLLQQPLLNDSYFTGLIVGNSIGYSLIVIISILVIAAFMMLGSAKDDDNKSTYSSSSSSYSRW